MVKSNLLILSCAILLSGCALFNKPQPGIEVQTQKVEIPVAVPCKAVVPKVPSWNFDKLTTANDIFTKDQYLLADRQLHLGYEDQLLAALNSCIK
jgi:hypothetical protein